jgi:hypothetical protein
MFAQLNFGGAAAKMRCESGLYIHAIPLAGSTLDSLFRNYTPKIRV